GVLGAEWLVVYVRPPELDVGDKAAKKVFDKLRDDFSPRGRTRVVRLDPPKGYSAAALAALAAVTAGSTGGSGGSSNLHNPPATYNNNNTYGNASNTSNYTSNHTGSSISSTSSSWVTPRGGGMGPPSVVPTPGGVGTVAGGGGGGSSSGMRVAGGGGGGVVVQGLDEFESGLRECVRSSFEARQAAYMAEVQRLANERRDPGWSFSSLYLVKDSLALLLEGCGLAADAYKEYVELEAAYQETLDRQRSSPAPAHAPAPGGGASGGLEGMGSGDCADDEFGAGGEGADVASLISASWRVTRRCVLKRAAIQEFRFRQYLFASQARLLLRLGRPVEVAERGLRFIAATAAELGQREGRAGAQGGVRPLLKEAWTFSACMAVIGAVTAAVFGRDTPPGGQQAGTAAAVAAAGAAAGPPTCLGVWEATAGVADPAG
ncbi:hypothetical protein Agub_g8110, partial [Astrephomene gubernaculifera]